MYQKYGKRALDFILSLGASSVCPGFCWGWRWPSSWTAPARCFFKQKRVGHPQDPLHDPEFRTMRSDTPHDMPTHLLADPDQYITRVGHFLRKTSLDELPQLWNILVGDMAVIGPRPALWNQYDLLPSGTSTAPRRAPRPHRPGPDPRPGRAGNSGESQAGRGLCGPHHLLGGCEAVSSAPSAQCCATTAWWKAAPAPCTGTGQGLILPAVPGILNWKTEPSTSVRGSYDND